MAWEGLLHDFCVSPLLRYKAINFRVEIRHGLQSPSGWKLLGGRQAAAKQKEKLSNYLTCQNTDSCEIVSCLLQEVFKHGVLQWAGD